jgi:hypothetical protein
MVLQYYGWVWWCTPVISALQRLRPENHKFNGRLWGITGPCLKKEKTKQNTTIVNVLSAPESCTLKVATAGLHNKTLWGSGAFKNPPEGLGKKEKRNFTIKESV